MHALFQFHRLEGDIKPGFESRIRQTESMKDALTKFMHYMIQGHNGAVKDYRSRPGHPGIVSRPYALAPIAVEFMILSI